MLYVPDSKVRGADMGPTLGWHDLGGANVSPMKIAIWDILRTYMLRYFWSAWKHTQV